MYPLSLRALAADVLFNDITHHFDYIMELDHAIGYTHDVGSRLLEMNDICISDMQKEKYEKLMQKEKYEKLMRVFAYKICHQEKHLKLFLSPHSMLLKQTYFTRFMEVCGSRVSEVIMTDSHFKGHWVTYPSDTINIQDLIKVLATNNTVNLRELKLKQWCHNSYAHRLTSLRWLYQSHLPQTLTVLHLCHVDFSFCAMIHVRQCIGAMINLKELRVVRGNFRKAHRHPFTLPLLIPEMTRRDHCTCTRTCNKRKRDSDENVNVNGGIHCQCHEENAQTSVSSDIDIPRNLEVLVFTEYPLNKWDICSSPTCPQIQEFDSLFLHYPKLRVLDLSDVNLHSQSIKSIISNNTNIEQLVLTPLNNEQMEIINYHKKQKDKDNKRKKIIEKKSNDYNEMIKYINSSNCTLCLLGSQRLRSLAQLVVDMDEKDSGTLKTNKVEEVLGHMMNYTLRHYTNFNVIRNVLMSTKHIISNICLTSSVDEINVWLSHIQYVLRFCDCYHTIQTIRELMEDICESKIMKRAKKLRQQ